MGTWKLNPVFDRESVRFVPSSILEELNLDLSNSTARASAAQNLDDTSLLGAILLFCDNGSKESESSSMTCLGVHLLRIERVSYHFKSAVSKGPERSDEKRKRVRILATN